MDNNNLNQENNFSDSEDTSFDVKIWIIRICKGWYFFVISLVLFMGIAYLQNRSWQPVYRSSALVIIEENKGLAGAQSVMQGFGLQKGYRNVNNQIVMFSSQDLIEKVVKRMPQLAVDYYAKGRFKTSNLYKISPIVISSLYIAPNAYEREFSIKDIGNDFYEISFEGNKETPTFSAKGRYGKQLETSMFFITINKTPFYRNKFDICFTFKNLDALAADLHSRLAFDFKMTGSSVIEVSLTGNVYERDCDFLNTLCDEFLAEDLVRKNDAAVKTVDFIDTQMSEISDSLRISENRLQNYKANNFMVSTGSGADLAAKYNTIDSKQTELRLKESYINYLTHYLEHNMEDGSVIAPASLGVDDANLSSLVNQFTDLQVKKKEVGAKSPYYAKYSRDIENVKAQMFEALKNIRVGFNIEKADWEKRNKELMTQVRELPYKEQQLLNFERKFKMNDDYYSFLMEKRADAQIQRASNSPDNIILDKARMSSITNASSKGSNYTTFFLIGLVIPLIFLLIRELLYPFIRTENEIISLSKGVYSILGIIRHTNSNLPVIVDKYPRSVAAESFRVARARIEFITSKTTSLCVMFTSTHSGDGKTYIAANMAGIFALTGRKTILVDLDLRQPSVSASLFIPNNKGLSNYLAGQIDLDEAIVKDSNYKFDVMTVGVIPPNPGELIKSAKMEGLIEILKERYDYVLFDASPIGLVADAYSIINQVDLNIYVVRAEKTDKSFFKKVITQLRSDNIKNIYFLFNDVNLKKLEYSSYYNNYAKYGKSYNLTNILSRNGNRENNEEYFDKMEDDV